MRRDKGRGTLCEAKRYSQKKTLRKKRQGHKERARAAKAEGWMDTKGQEGITEGEKATNREEETVTINRLTTAV